MRGDEVAVAKDLKVSFVPLSVFRTATVAQQCTSGSFTLACPRSVPDAHALLVPVLL